MTSRIGVLFGLVAAIAAVACVNDRGAAPTQQVTLSDSADQIVHGVKHIMWAGGLKQGQLNADTAFVFENTTKFDLRNVRVLLYDSVGALSATLTSKTATYSTTRQNLDARGDVVVVTVKNERLESQQLLYDQGTNRVTSPSAFTLIEPARRITGASFSSDPKLQSRECQLCTYSGSTPPPSGGPPAGGVTPPVRTDTLLHQQREE